jgi:hypothetical protein
MAAVTRPEVQQSSPPAAPEVAPPAPPADVFWGDLLCFRLWLAGAALLWIRLILDAVLGR